MAGAARSLRRLAQQVPKPLALLLVVVSMFAATWALLVPAWGGPDEDVHFAYVQTLAERHEIPHGSATGPVSTEQSIAMKLANTDPVVIFPYAKPEWSKPVGSEALALSSHASRSDGGAFNAAATYPPSYYLLETIPYEIASSGSLFTRIYAMRLFSELWLLVSTVAAWLLAGEVFGRRRLPQLVTAAGVGLWPMTTFLSGVINPDAMLIALWTLTGWLGTSLIKRGLGFRRAAGLCLCVGVALATKAPALALLPPFAFALGVAAWRARGKLTRRSLVPIAVAALLFLVPVVSWYQVSKSTGNGAYSQVAQVSKNKSSGGGANPAGGGAAHGSGIRSPSVNEFASYLWQYYLPKLPFQHDIRFLFPVISHNAGFQNWIGGGWANFGWANVWFPPWVYKLFGIAVALALLAALLTAFRALRARRRGGSRFGIARPDLVLPAFFVLLSAGLWAGLHWTDFHMYLTHSAPFLQGRYLLPLGALFSLVLAQSTQVVPQRFRGAAAAAVIGGLVVLQLACLGLIVSRYYA